MPDAMPPASLNSLIFLRIYRTAKTEVESGTLAARSAAGVGRSRRRGSVAIQACLARAPRCGLHGTRAWGQTKTFELTEAT
jgi:hypothetical protein